MRILLIEDSEEKIEEIEDALKNSLPGSEVFPTIVRTMADAVRTTSALEYDLIVLDLMIPYLDGTNASSEAGYELLRQMRSEGPNRYTKVISISAHPDEVAAYRAKFDQLAVLITEFDGEGAWRDTLRALLRELEAGPQKPRSLDFLIVCALEKERNGYEFADLKAVADVSISGLNIRFAKSDACGFGAILRASDMGLVTATHEIGLALHIFSTKILAMSGICAGFNGKAALGQVICAAPAWEYQAGKWADDGFEIAPLQVPIPAETRGIVDHVFDRKGLVEGIEAKLTRDVAKPAAISKPQLAPMATGSAVIAESTRLAHIKAQHRKVAALDMETYGLYYVAHQRAKEVEHFFSIKTVVDLADANKGDELHQYGCIVSANVTCEVIKSIRSEGTTTAERPSAQVH